MLKLKEKHLKGDFAQFGINDLGKCTDEELKKVYNVAPTLFEEVKKQGRPSTK